MTHLSGSKLALCLPPSLESVLYKTQFFLSMIHICMSTMFGTHIAQPTSHCKAMPGTQCCSSKCLALPSHHRTRSTQASTWGQSHEAGACSRPDHDRQTSISRDKHNTVNVRTQPTARWSSVCMLPCTGAAAKRQSFWSNFMFNDTKIVISKFPVVPPWLCYFRPYEPTHVR